MSTILAVSAHPDDATLFAGGTLAMYAGQGHDVYLLDTTRGEGGETGDVPHATKENLGQVREEEERNAAKALGLKDVFFLPFIDPNMEIGGTPLPIEVSMETFSQAIGEYLTKLQPHLIITHGSNGEYGHPQHVYTHQAVGKALSQTNSQIAFMTWQAWQEKSTYKLILNKDDPANIIYDITPWIDAKTKAALCYKTQHVMFLRNSGLSSVADMIWPIESYHIVKGPLPKDVE